MNQTLAFVCRTMAQFAVAAMMGAACGTFMDAWASHSSGAPEMSTGLLPRPSMHVTKGVMLGTSF